MSSKKIVIGTHHKSGTNYFVNCLRALQRKNIISLWEITQDISSHTEPDCWDVHFDHWSAWRLDLDKYDFKGMHCIRDPLSLLYSSVNYHLKSDENWLHQVKPHLGGLTYAQHLKSLPTLKERMIFELNASTGSVIKQMYTSFKDNRFYHIQLENISFDVNMTQINDAFDYIELDGADRKMWTQVFKKRCIWNLPEKPKHSTTGMSNEWRKLIDDELISIFHDKFGPIEVEMGYSSYL